MPTSNFNLPLINGSSPISIVNDMNSLATATDSAMATLATQSDIATVRQIANNASATANDANTAAQEAAAKADTANGTATAASASAVSASATANQAMTTANGASEAVSAITTGAYTELSLGTISIPSGTGSGTFTGTLYYNKALRSGCLMVAMTSSTYSISANKEGEMTFSVKIPDDVRIVPALDVTQLLFAHPGAVSMHIGFNANGEIKLQFATKDVVSNWGFNRHMINFALR